MFFFTEIDLNQLLTVLVIVLSCRQNKFISDEVKPIWKQVKPRLVKKHQVVIRAEKNAIVLL